MLLFLKTKSEKESEARTKLEALKIQMQLIAEYGRRLIEMEVRKKI